MALSDEVIQRNVLDQFKYDVRMKPTEIGVAVKDGVVILSGRVDNYSKKWNAEQIALRVAGVKSVVNNLEVVLPTQDERTDEDIARAAKTALDLAYDIPKSVKAVVEKGWVTLRGEVPWFYQKEAAERKIRDIAGVRGVTNLIEVKPTVKTEDVKRRIEEALVRAAEIDAKNIQVDALDGKVILRGHVHSYYEKQEVKRQAWLAPGVREVVDELQIA